jgi:hypothetical protein
VIEPERPEIGKHQSRRTHNRNVTAGIDTTKMRIKTQGSRHRGHYTIPRRAQLQQMQLYDSPMSEHQRTRVAGVTAAVLGALSSLILPTAYARQSEMSIRVDVDLPASARILSSRRHRRRARFA